MPAYVAMAAYIRRMDYRDIAASPELASLALLILTFGMRLKTKADLEQLRQIAKTRTERQILH